MNVNDELDATIHDLVQDGRGILAADESVPTISKRFKAVGIESSEDTRRAYRELLLMTPGIGEFISGIILFEETLGQKTADGSLFPEAAKRGGIVPGIKVDKGPIALVNAAGDMVTQGLDGLADRIAQYKTQGARFAKWREVYPITLNNPTRLGMETNANVLARYASICQEQGIVPIVEPEVLIDGEHSIERCAEVTEAVLHEVFLALYRQGVSLEHMLLKPNMIVPGKAHTPKAAAQEVADMTIAIFSRVVPAAVPSINFLSGGLSPEDASAYLNAMNATYPHAPWALSFSYARALQEPPMSVWRGKAENVAAAQSAFYKRARLNSAACRGQYGEAMEKTA